MFLHYINTKQKHIKVFFLPNANNILIRYSPHPLCCSSLHPFIYSIRQRRKNAHETFSISASPSTVPVFKFKFLYYAPHMYYYSVFQTSLHIKRKLTLKNMNGRLYCCYQNSPYQLCPHILVFMFKNYIPHRQTDRHTHTQTNTHTHTQYVYYYKNISIILITNSNVHI